MELMALPEWSAPRAVAALMSDARGLRDKVWVVSYFASRAAVAGRRPLGFLAPKPRRLSWRSAPTRLAVSVESGGLSAWYETSLRHVYAPTTDFIPRSGWTVIDVGANIGAYTTWAAAHLGEGGRLVAIEPNPVSYEMLTRSIEGLPGLVTAHQLACAAEEGELPLYSRRGYTVSSSLAGFDGAERTDMVRVRRLDDVLAEQGVQVVDMLKIDVEGAELAVLQGAQRTLASTNRVVLETTAGQLSDAVEALLGGLGFELVARESDHWSIQGLEILAFQRLAM
jgi:FkbM family methyltransferase